MDADIGREPTRSREEIEAFIAKVLSIPAHATFGLALESWAFGEAHLVVTAGPASLVWTGGFHGGLFGLLVEPTALIALVSTLPRDRYAVTVDVHTQILRAVEGGARVDFTGRVVRPGRQLAFCEAEARVGGRLVAQSRLTKAIVPA